MKISQLYLNKDIVNISDITINIRVKIVNEYYASFIETIEKTTTDNQVLAGLWVELKNIDMVFSQTDVEHAAKKLKASYLY